ncbi:MAG: hypothetical protein ACW98X_02125 [Promethearchaeota archaeon]|jgi:hypothetical protein
MSDLGDFKESHNHNDKISSKLSLKNNNFLRAKGKFIVSGIIALLSTFSFSLGIIYFYINLLNGHWLFIFTFIGVIQIAINFHIPFVLSIVILILSIKGIVGYFKENRGETYVT